MYAPNWWLPLVRLARVVVVFSLLGTPAYAHRTLDIASGLVGRGTDGTGWQASVDQINWFPVIAPYPNPFSKPKPNLNGGPIPDAGTSNAQLMWWVPPGDPVDGSSGPNTLFFKYEFELNTATLDGGGLTHAWVAADDWMKLSVNGNEVGTYLLDDHKLANGQPAPVMMEFNAYLNDILVNGVTDHNVILIEAHDGGAVASDRLFEWVFFDSQAQPLEANQPIFIAAVPAPAALWLMIVGVGAACATRRSSGPI